MPLSLDYWRRFLRTSNRGIFETIEYSILVAANDYPEQFERKKEFLQKTISTARSRNLVDAKRFHPKKMGNLVDCIDVSEDENTQLSKKKDKGKVVIESTFPERIESWTSDEDEDEDDDDNLSIKDWFNRNLENRERKQKGKRVVSGYKRKYTKKTSWCREDVRTETGSSSMCNVFGTVNLDGSAAHLVAKVVEEETVALRKESDVLGDVVKIKDALMKLKGQPVIAYDLLMKLEKMQISAHVLQVTDIADTVRIFARNDFGDDSRQTCLLALDLLESWKTELDKWLNNGNSTRDDDQITVATKYVVPKISIVALPSVTRRTGYTQCSEGLSKPQSSKQIDIGSRGTPANARSMVSQPAYWYHQKSRQSTSGSQVQIGGSSRENSTTLQNQPRAGLQGPQLTAKESLDSKNKIEVPTPAKKIEVDPVRESLKIAKQKLQERQQKSQQANTDKSGTVAINNNSEPKSSIGAGPSVSKKTENIQFSEGPSKPRSSETRFNIGSRGPSDSRCVVVCQPVERYHCSNKQFAMKEIRDDKNKMKAPAPVKKSEEDPVQESLKIAQRKVQETLQKSQQSTNKVSVATYNGELKCAIAAGPTKRTGSIQFSEGLSKPRSSQLSFHIGTKGPAKVRLIEASQSAKWYPSENRQLASGSRVQIGGSSRASDNISQSQPRNGQGPKLTAEQNPDTKNKMEVPAQTKKIGEDAIRENIKMAKRKLQETLQKSEQAKRHNTGPRNSDKDTPIGELLSQYRRGPC